MNKITKWWNDNASTAGGRMLRKVPEVTIFFWIIKVLCTTVGESAADFLNVNLNLGLTNTTYIMSALLVIALFFQFKSKRYVPGLYWLVVVLISVVGTLVTDNLTDGFGVPLLTATIVFSIILAIVFAGWYLIEKTLSIHSIYTMRREAFYWLAILFTFAVGTAAGDLSAEAWNLGYLISIFIFAGLIAAVTIIYYIAKAKMGPMHRHLASSGVLAFWLAYIFTRPLGASIGDFLSQTQGDGGLGLGTLITSAIFLLAILGTVIYLTITKKDVEKAEALA